MTTPTSTPAADHPVLAFQASARSDGDTSTLLNALIAGRPATQVVLAQRCVAHYCYGESSPDDFGGLVSSMCSSSTIIFATPVYWYSMSSYLKVVFDRLTELLDNGTSQARKLVGKDVYLLACGTERELPEGFEIPFSRTADYFKMHYRGALYVQTAPGRSIPDSAQSRAKDFGDLVFATLSDDVR